MGEAKPSEFFVGVVEFFGVLLPGAILLATGVWVWSDELPPDLKSEAQWVAFAVVAYALGTFLFLLSAVIDEVIYDPWREARWPKAMDFAFKQAEAIRDAALAEPPVAAPRLQWPPETKPPARLPDLKTRWKTFREKFAEVWSERVLLKPGKVPTASMNTLSWTKSVLILQAPAAYADVLRYEAESKFFRSMILVALIAGPLAAAKLGTPGAAFLAIAAGGLVMVLSFLRYAERRYKGSEWAYRYLIARQFGPSPPPPTGGRE